MKRLCELLDHSEQRYPHKTALITDEGHFTYSQLTQERDRISTYLQTCGVKTGERIILLLPHGKFLVSSIYAASRLGATYILLHESTTRYQLDYIVKDSQASYLLTTDAFVEKLAMSSYIGIKVISENDVTTHAVEHSRLDDPDYEDRSGNEVACLLYTSGSTGRPKAVVSHHSSMLFVLESIQSCLKIEADDVIGNFLPLSFDYGMYQIFLAFNQNATIALGQRSDVGPALIHKIREWGITGLPIVPSMGEALIKLMRRQMTQLPEIRFITNTGAALPQTYVNEFKTFFPNARLHLMYGLTECKRVSILQPEFLADKPGSVGTSLPGTSCTIIDERGLQLPPNKVGELVVHGPHVMMGYWNDPQRTQHVFRNMASPERSLHTGDYFWMDDEGFLYFYARKDDMYKQNGFRVSPTEIELAAVDIDGVEQAALILTGDTAVPILAVSSTRTADSLLDELRMRLEDYKMPAHIYVTDQLPLTSNGKIDKNKLKTDLEKE